MKWSRDLLFRVFWAVFLSLVGGGAALMLGSLVLMALFVAWTLVVAFLICVLGGVLATIYGLVGGVLMFCTSTILPYWWASLMSGVVGLVVAFIMGYTVHTAAQEIYS